MKSLIFFQVVCCLILCINPILAWSTRDAQIHNETQRSPTLNQIGEINCLNHTPLHQDQMLSLIHAIEKALCFNPETNIAWVQTKLYAAQRGISKSLYYPQVQSRAGYNWNQERYRMDDANASTQQLHNRQYTISVEANWLLYDFGARRAQLKEADKLFAMSMAEHNQTLQALTLKTIANYYYIIQLELKQESFQQLVKLAQDNFTIAHARYSAGIGIKADELQMKANLAKAQSDLIQINAELKISKGNLAILMGEPSFQNFQVNKDMHLPRLLDLKPIQSLLDESFVINPQLQSARYATEAAEAKVKASKTANYPTISLVNRANYTTQLNSGASPQNSDTLFTGIEVGFTLFDGFNTRSQVNAAQQQFKLRQLAETQLKLQNSVDIWKSYNELQATHESITALAELNESASQAYEVVQGRYKAGIGNILEVLNAQNIYIEARLNYSTALTQFLVTRYQLLASIGNLNIWQQRTHQVNQ